MLYNLAGAKILKFCKILSTQKRNFGPVVPNTSYQEHGRNAEIICPNWGVGPFLTSNGKQIVTFPYGPFSHGGISVVVGVLAMNSGVYVD